jgi:hypothetical protein
VSRSQLEIRQVFEADDRRQPHAELRQAGGDGAARGELIQWSQ